MSFKRVALVTGGNRGLGLEAVDVLSSSDASLLVLVGSRSAQAGETVVKDRFKHRNNIKVLPLDVTSQSSVDNAVDIVKQQYGGHLDILINNAGVFFFSETLEDATTIMEVNVIALNRVYHAFYPLLRENARVSYVGSELGQFHLYTLPSSLRSLFESSSLTESNVLDAAKDYLNAVKEKKVREVYGGTSGGFSYTYSKVLVHALLRVHSRLNTVKGAIYVAVNPGFCATDLNGHSGHFPASTGGKHIADSVLTANDPKLNGFYYDQGTFTDQYSAPWPEAFKGIAPQ